MIDGLIKLLVVRYPLEPLLPRIWDLSQNLSAYDTAYVAIAEALKRALLTCNATIVKAPGLAAVIVDYLPSSAVFYVRKLTVEPRQSVVQRIACPNSVNRCVNYSSDTYIIYIIRWH